MENFVMESLRMLVSTVLPQVMVGSIIALMIGIPVGGIIGHIVGAIFRRKEATVIPAVLASSLGVLIVAVLPVISQPGFLDGGAYAAILLRVVLFLLIPLGAIVGGIVGSIFGLIFGHRLRPRAGWISFFLSTLS